MKKKSDFPVHHRVNMCINARCRNNTRGQPVSYFKGDNDPEYHWLMRWIFGADVKDFPTNFRTMKCADADAGISAPIIFHLFGLLLTQQENAVIAVDSAD